MKYGTMIRNSRNVRDHLKDVAEADDLKQHVYMSDRNHQHHCPTVLASALQEMRKARYVSVISDEVTSRKTRRKALLNCLLLQRTDGCVE